MEFGQIPKQLFVKPHPKRRLPSPVDEIMPDFDEDMIACRESRSIYIILIFFNVQLAK